MFRHLQVAFKVDPTLSFSVVWVRSAVETSATPASSWSRDGKNCQLDPRRTGITYVYALLTSNHLNGSYFLLVLLILLLLLNVCELLGG